MWWEANMAKRNESPYLTGLRSKEDSNAKNAILWCRDRNSFHSFVVSDGCRPKQQYNSVQFAGASAG
jgi:hypothetical protein